MGAELRSLALAVLAAAALAGCTTTSSDRTTAGASTDEQREAASPAGDGATDATPRAGSGTPLEVTLDFATWSTTLPDIEELAGGEPTEADEFFALRTDEDVEGVVAVGGRAAAVQAEGAVTIARSLLGGANDGLKTDDGTTLVDTAVTLAYDLGAHADHVQVRDDDDVTLERLVLVAENANGAIDSGWNAAIFIHGSSTDWTIRDVHVRATDDPSLAITSWFPVRLGAGSGSVERLVVDREVMKGDAPVRVDDDVALTRWEDVYIREPDGSLTPVPDPTRGGG